MKRPLLALSLLISTGVVSAAPQAQPASSASVASTSSASQAAATAAALVAADALAAASVSSVLSSAGVVTPTVLVTTIPTLNPNAIVSALPAPSTASPGGAVAAQYSGPAWLKNTQQLVAALAQDVTNGNSNLGTLGLPDIAAFLNTPGTPLQDGTPWGDRNSNNTNYYSTQSVPNTGMTRTYDFTVATQTIAPDGVTKPGLVINGGFPGPLIEANWGDWILVNVHNNLANEGTSLHWHGFLQQGTPYMDGVPSVQQCPIAPGKSFQYRFRATLYGTSWYHSHYSAQYAGGALGPIIVHGPTPYGITIDRDIGPIMISDWYHDDYFTLVKQVETPVSIGQTVAPAPPASNNILINGKNNYPCGATTKACVPNAGIAKFNFTSGEYHRLRLINPSAEATLKFSIDSHQFTVFANDFVQIQPYVTDVITLGVGQRSDVIVKATGKPKNSYWMRVNSTCSVTDGVSPFAVAAIYYEKADTNSVPTSNMTVSATALARCKNDDLSKTIPLLPLTPDPIPDVTQDFVITFVNNATATSKTGQFVWDVNNSSFRGDYNDPLLLEAKLGNFEFEPQWNVYNFQRNNTVRAIWYNTFTFGPHPLHLHGFNAYILDEGFGTWKGTIQNQANPQRRDVQLVQPAKDANTPAYVVMQLEVDNPGVWPFHCHIAWHVSGGLYVNMIVRPDEITENEIPMIMAQTCRDWSAFTNKTTVDQIDSGL